MINIFINIIYFEILQTCRQTYAWLTPLIFFSLVSFLFSVALEGNPVLLKKLAPEIIWIAALLSILISLDGLFRQKNNLDLLLLSPQPLTIIVVGKLISYWITHCLPLILICPLLGGLFQMSWHTQWILILTLLLGTPTLCLLGGIGAALLVGLRTSGLLLPVLIMPLYVPVLILGVGTVSTDGMNLTVRSGVALLSALALFSLTFAPFLTSLSLRIGVKQ